MQEEDAGTDNSAMQHPGLKIKYVEYIDPRCHKSCTYVQPVGDVGRVRHVLCLRTQRFHLQFFKNNIKVSPAIAHTLQLSYLSPSLSPVFLRQTPLRSSVAEVMSEGRGCVDPGAHTTAVYTVCGGASGGRIRGNVFQRFWKRSFVTPSWWIPTIIFFSPTPIHWKRYQMTYSAHTTKTQT